MSTAAIMWTHNEPDVLIPNIRYLLSQVDEILIRDRDSEKKVLSALGAFGDPVVVTSDDGRFGHDQSKLMTDMADWARERGHEWVLPIDPDEVWYANERTISDFLAGVSRDVAIVKSELYNHVATVEDPSGDPFRSIGWRQRAPLPLGKVACRTRPDLVIEGGNHSARTSGIGFSAGPWLVIRHFPYRSEDQFVEKVRSNWEQMKKSSLPASFGVHIRAYGKCLDEEGEEALRRHFRHWFYSPHPGRDDSLVYDPAPV